MPPNRLKSIRALLGVTLFFCVKIEAYADSVPEDLVRIRNVYHGEIERATQPIHQDYIRKLERLKETLTRSGELEGALTVSNELQRLRATGTWEWSNAGKSLTIWVRSDGTFSTSENDKVGSWSIANGMLRIWDVSLSHDEGKWTGKREHNQSKAVLKRK